MCGYLLLWIQPTEQKARESSLENRGSKRQAEYTLTLNTPGNHHVHGTNDTLIRNDIQPTTNI